MNLGRTFYNSTTPPDGYRCATCNAFGCKLWRESNVFSNHVTLLCCDCAALEEKKDVMSIDANGKRETEYGDRTDQIGWHIPAVPTEEGDTYWGYTSVPKEGCDWWRALPTRLTSTDRRTLVAMFTRAGIKYEEPCYAGDSMRSITIEAGYVGFMTIFSFTDEGALKSIEARE
jgi:hypothetical protein